MGNEIQKWTPREGRIAELRRYQETRLQVKTNSRLIPANNLPGEVIDLLRICAVHDKPYVARYILGADGVYRFSQTIQITKRSHRDQYEGNAQSHLVDSRNFAGDEACAWCRARAEEVGGSKSVLCGSCRMEICYGRTTADGYFYCRPSCGKHGQLAQPSHRSQQGFRPEIRDGL